MDRPRAYSANRNKSLKDVPYDFTHVEFKKQNKGAKSKKKRERQTKKQTLNYREASGYQMGGDGGMGVVGGVQ